MSDQNLNRSTQSSESTIEVIAETKEASLNSNRKSEEPMEECIDIDKAHNSSDTPSNHTEQTRSTESCSISASSITKSFSSMRRSTRPRRDHNKSTRKQKQKKPIIKKKNEEQQTLTKAVQKFAISILASRLDRHRLVSTNECFADGTIQACQVCGQSACLENCLECGKKSCPVRTKQLALVMAQCAARPTTRDVKIQKGSRAACLSPLCLSMCAQNEEEKGDTSYKAISTEMILESIDILEKKRLNPTTDDVMEFLQRRYALNPKEEALRKELSAKLKDAASLGLVESLSENTWRLASIRYEGNMAKNQVSAFWEKYLNTITPLPLPNPRMKKSEESSTRTCIR